MTFATLERTSSVGNNELIEIMDSIAYRILCGQDDFDMMRDAQNLAELTQLLHERINGT